MNWLNLELTTLRSEQFLGSEPVERATWLCLMAYCADQENGGVMHCGEWGDRKLQQLIGVTSKEIRAPSELWSWTGNDLRVWGYPTDKEEEVKANRENGRKGGRPKKSASEKPKQNHPVIESENHMVNQVVPNRLNGKERKGIGKEEERNTIPRGRWNLKPLAVALQKRYNIGCPDMVGSPLLLTRLWQMVSILSLFRSSLTGWESVSLSTSSFRHSNARTYCGRSCVTLQRNGRSVSRN